MTTATLPAYQEPPGITHCGPGQCTCGATIDAQGAVTAPAPREAAPRPASRSRIRMTGSVIR